MSRKCKITYCNNLCEFRKQYCNSHRNIRNRIPSRRHTQLSPIAISATTTPPFEDISETIRQQNIEYEETLKADMKNIHEKESESIFQNDLADVIKLSLIHEKDLKKSKLQITNTLDSENITVKFRLPDSSNVINIFRPESTFQDLHNFIDYYLLENNIDLYKYDLVLGFPKTSFTDKEAVVIDSVSSKNIVLHVKTE